VSRPSWILPHLEPSDPQYKGAVASVLLWDGSTPGTVFPSSAVCAGNISAMEKSLSAAAVCADHPTLTQEGLMSLKGRITAQHPPLSLHGAPLTLTSISGDVSTRDTLEKLKPGTWVRFRNVHLHTNSSRVLFCQPPPLLPLSAAVSPSPSSSQTSFSQSSSSSSSSSSAFFSAVSSTCADTRNISHSVNYADTVATRSLAIGTIHTDTHISILKPYFK
jgi:hypothetical protein